jgi:Flp pilus assembly protein CpaB
MLQNVKLLGIAQDLTDTTGGGNLSDKVDDSENGDADPGASTAVIQVEPKQAQDITWADQFGILRFEARPAGDSVIQDVEPTLVRLENTR